MTNVELLPPNRSMPSERMLASRRQLESISEGPTRTWRWRPSRGAGRPRDRRAIGIGAAVVLTVACTVVSSLLIVGQPSSIRPSVSAHAARAEVLPASAIRLISTSTAAVADSGSAVESTTNSGGVVSLPPTTLDVTFSGQDVNYLVASTGQGAEGVENRIVDGQLYLYIKGQDLEMHWYHDTTPGAATSLGSKIRPAPHSTVFASMENPPCSGRM
jgi:hypothetical protein